jgi:hypothetical protein
MLLFFGFVKRNFVLRIKISFMTFSVTFLSVLFCLMTLPLSTLLKVEIETVCEKKVGFSS